MFLDSFIYMFNTKSNISVAVITTFAMFLFVALGLILLVVIYNRRKRKHIEERKVMQLAFESEIAKTQQEIQEQTMQTIGAELHDNIGQLLSLTSLTLSSIELGNPARARQKINDSIDLTLRSIRELRLLGHLLQADRLVVAGLTAALLQLVSWLERTGRYEVIFRHSDEIPANGNADKDLIIFRIAQEVSSNIIKHASATRIEFKLDYNEGAVILQITDNGIGFIIPASPSASGGMGLQNIRKRTAIIGGEAFIESAPGRGSAVTITVPYS